MPNSICLALIVRDTESQGKNVARCILSAAPICDRALIIDTGSVDETEKVVIATCEEAGLPLDLRHSEWVGHAHNRSELLQACRENDEVEFVLMLDADMELVIEKPLPDLVADEYMIPVHDRGMIYPLPLLTSNRRAFAYAGVTHAHVIVTDVEEKGPVNGLRLTGMLKILDHGGGGQGEKLERDMEVLRAAVAENPNDSRSWFYLAQTYRDLDRVEEAVMAYKIRAMLGGWQEEVYQSLYQAGALMCRHISFYDGVKLLVSAAELRKNRAEALRVLVRAATSVADTIPFPYEDVLFIEPSAYTVPDPAPMVPPGPPPPRPDIRPATKPIRRKKITAEDVTAIIVTRGNVDLEPVIETLPYPDIIVWDNSLRDHDYKLFGRYAAIPQALNPVIFWVDDDVIFTNHDALLAEWEPGKVVANMDDDWVNGAGYGDDLVLLGAGSLCPAWLPNKIFHRYLRHHSWDDDLLVEADFAFGTLAPRKRVDLGYETRSFTDDPDRLYRQPGQTERKWAMIDRCKALRRSSSSLPR